MKFLHKSYFGSDFKSHIMVLDTMTGEDEDYIHYGGRVLTSRGKAFGSGVFNTFTSNSFLVGLGLQARTTEELGNCRFLGWPDKALIRRDGMLIGNGIKIELK